MKWLTDALLGKILLVGSVALLVLIPFHAFLTVWIASFGLNYTAVRLWKEILLLLLCAVAVLLWFRSAPLRASILRIRLLRYLLVAIGLYGLLHLFIGLLAVQFNDLSLTAFGYALISNLRFLAFLLIMIMVGTLYQDWFTRYWVRLLLGPAAIVVIFGLLQEFILPYDVLRYFGYGSETIQPYIAVDQKVEFARLQSTLRGPNPLGAYLVIILTALVGLFITRKERYSRWAVGILGTVLVLYGSFSRSAWIGAAVAVGLLIWWLMKSAKTKKYLMIISACAVLFGAGLVYGLRDNDYVQNVVFHTDETSQSSTSSNEERASALMMGAQDVFREPFGRGPGTAGPASFYSNETPRIAENYFVQIGQELGFIGIMTVLAIMGVIGLLLWRLIPQSVFAGVLLASFVGLTAINMLSHAWADDTLAYVWWGFAGLIIGSSIKLKHVYEKNSKAK